MPRPHITCHMITTIDGRLHTERWPQSQTELLAVYDRVAARIETQGWIVGRVSLEGWLPHSEPMLDPVPSSRTDLFANRAGRRIGIIFDRSGRVLPDTDELEGDHLVLVLSGRVSQAHVDRLVARGISVVFSGPEGDDIEGALVRIAQTFGIDRLLLEGGGTLNGAFLAKGLIDATSTLVLPVIDGAAGTPAIYERQGEMPASALVLTHVETLEGGVVWLRHTLHTS
ncbi:dihydrofolate reductase family protein [Pseudodonghicola xiamenensis]|uniref:Riboflavin deaminase n=1 Tax=Pseudodonghicola xiamenensis TaxID=337702 RepID=A0A8J3MEF7_9RHOB|nr:dihydrofolate reductase family protein [Pseudodonghicola xiamenensis]GHH03509.1 riboflavin deaminase [Pseudodonghicola xiamenensis]